MRGAAVSEKTRTMSTDDTSATRNETESENENEPRGAASFEDVTGTPANEKQRKRTDGVVRFAGTNPREIGDVEIPSWWKARNGDEEPSHSLREVARMLPRSATTEVAWKNPETGEWHKTEKHNGLYNPHVAAKATFGTYEEARDHFTALAKEFEERDGMTLSEFSERVEASVRGTDVDEVVGAFYDSANSEEFGRRAAAKVKVGDDALWNIPTDSYSVINPATFLDPLCDVLEDSDNDLDGHVFGEFELSRGGGRVQGDIFFDARSIDFTTDEFENFSNTPVMLGVEVGWDFFGGMSAYAQGMGMDTGCTNSMRALTDKVTVRHTGNVGERLDFWEDMLKTIDLLTSEMAGVIVTASETEVDFNDLPFGLEEFYEHLGLPFYLAEHAASDVRANAIDPHVPTMWDLYSGGTYAVTHFADGGFGSIEDHHRVVKDLLFNPAQSAESVSDSYEAEQERLRMSEQQRISGPDVEGLGPDADAEEGSFTSGGIAQVAAFRDSLRDREEEFANDEERIRNLYTIVSEGGADEEATQ